MKRVLRTLQPLSIVLVLLLAGCTAPLIEPAGDTGASEAEMTQTQQSKAVVQELFAVANQHDVDAYINHLADDFVNHSAPPNVPDTRAGYRQIYSLHAQAFPDFQISVEDMLAEDDTVTTRWTVHGTHQGNLMGIPPTNNEVDISGITINRVADGKVVEQWEVADNLGMMQQLGVAPVPDEAAQEPAINEVTFTAAEYTYNGPESIPAGWTRIRMENQGQEPHHAQLIKLPDDRSMDDLFQAMQADPPHPPEWLSFTGGPSVTMPGDGSAVTVDLEAGQYVLICVLEDDEGVTHAEHGMVRPLMVTPADEAAAEVSVPSPVDADITMTLLDFNFTLSDAITPGAHTFHVVNEGPQPHEVAVVELAPGTTAEEFIASEAPDAEGPPPGAPIGGLQVVDTGGEGFFTAEFQAGRDYLLICFYPDEETGQPHFALGMRQTISVPEQEATNAPAAEEPAADVSTAGQDQEESIRPLIQRYNQEVYIEHNLDALDALVAEDFRHHAPFSTPQGREGLRQFQASFFEAFPDGESEMETMVIDGNKAAVRYTFRATHQGEFMGTPATGNTVEVQGISIYRFEDGRIAEEWTQPDLMSMMQQLGVIPAPDAEETQG